MKAETFEAFCEGDTLNYAEKLGKEAKPGTLVALCGDLGSGKTVFARGFARGLGIKGAVSSPTFTILKSYEEGRLTLHHFDVYRLSGPDEMDEIGYEDCFYGDGVCLVEWAELIEELLPEDTIRVRIEKDPSRGFDFRRIILERPELRAGC
ncbi:MAG: tRNA (adenosine(37)-N6)-threonylcarbamoyltransferase complex ATPase subunit type 1 TsaE [Lachnospiraceae bacterium]|nr:tRNA (adenosine(37)-N6)-threonylcarbamoyltransferase complex ATPase subunit type 1 TsaE [Lachnospiraceae bacterium]